MIGLEFVTSGEFRTLAASYGNRRTGAALRKGRSERASGHDGKPVEEPTLRGPDEALTADEKTRSTAIGVATGGEVSDAAKDAWSRCKTIDEFIDYFIALGRKGVAINRYKGLGEMNPDTLWATTMNPEADAAAGEGRGSHRSGLDVHHAHGRPGGAAPQVHRGQRARRPNLDI